MTGDLFFKPYSAHAWPTPAATSEFPRFYLPWQPQERVNWQQESPAKCGNRSGRINPLMEKATMQRSITVASLFLGVAVAGLLPAAFGEKKGPAVPALNQKVLDFARA